MDVLGWIGVFIVGGWASVVIVEATGNKCTVIKAKPYTRYRQDYKPCKLSYRARCSWFSLDYCTFYHEQFCNKQYNITEMIYQTVTQCCQTYVEAPNGTCVAVSRVENDNWYLMQLNATTETPEFVNPIDIKPLKGHRMGEDTDDPSKVSKVDTERGGIALSHGAYAGIGCAILFLTVVGVLTFIGVRKRQRRFAIRKASHDRELDDQRIAIHTAMDNPET